MKSKDLFVVGGIGLLAYMLMSKPKVAEAIGGNGGGGITILPSQQAPFDLGALASILGAMPKQIIPEINIPEYKFPDPSQFIPEMPDWEKFIPNWEGFIPDWGELMPDWNKLIPSLIPDIPSLIPDIPDILNIFDGNGNGDKKVSQWDIWKKDTGATISDIGEFLRKNTTITSRFVPKAYYEKSALEWEEKEYPENITPEWWLEHKLGVVNDTEVPSLVPYEPNVGEVEAANIYPEYDSDIALLKKHPYFSTVID